MKQLVEDTYHITAKEAAQALPKDAETGTVSFEIAGQYIQEIAIVSTASNLEGLVRWFICPACQNRVGKLYLPSGEVVFLCRKCHDLAYQAQQLRAFRKPDSDSLDIAALANFHRPVSEDGQLRPCRQPCGRELSAPQPLAGVRRSGAAWLAADSRRKRYQGGWGRLRS